MKEYRITEKAGRFVAGRNSVGAGTSIFLTDKEAEYELSLGTIVPAEPEEAEPEDKGEDLSKLTKDALVALATERGVTVDPKATKAEIIAAIEAKAAADAAAA
ncbi:hypothetical protein K2X89_11725 [Myxococcota bacterium]|nr:hypothetical protein [Myxococcota bacterium]